MKMEKMGFKGRMYNWVMDFMMDHTIQVRVGSSYSKVYTIDNGTLHIKVVFLALFYLLLLLLIIFFLKLEQE